MEDFAAIKVCFLGSSHQLDGVYRCCTICCQCPCCFTSHFMKQTSGGQPKQIRRDSKPEAHTAVGRTGSHKAQGQQPSMDDFGL